MQHDHLIKTTLVVFFLLGFSSLITVQARVFPTHKGEWGDCWESCCTSVGSLSSPQSSPRGYASGICHFALQDKVYWYLSSLSVALLITAVARNTKALSFRPSKIRPRRSGDKSPIPFPLLGGLSGKVYTVTGTRQAESTNWKKTSERPELRFIEAQVTNSPAKWWRLSRLYTFRTRDPEEHLGKDQKMTWIILNGHDKSNENTAGKLAYRDQITYVIFEEQSEFVKTCWKTSDA